jgi:hypothetical protein
MLIFNKSEEAVMKNLNKSILFLFIILASLLTSCNSSDDESPGEIIPNEISEDAPVDTPEGSTINPSESTTVYSRKDFLKKFRVSDPIYLKPLEERLESLMSDKDYHFDILTGKCFNTSFEVERGDSNSLECNIPASIESRNDEFENYNFFGTDAKGVSVADANVSMYDLVFAEVKFNKDSVLNSSKKPFYKLFQNQKRVYFGQKRNERKYSNALKKYQEKRRTLKTKFKSAKNDKQRQKVKTQIDNLDMRIKLVKFNHKVARKKSFRHLKELKWISKTEELSGLKEKFSDKNRESTFFDGASAYSYLPSNEIFDTETFTISLWFKTYVNQQDKRIFNMHRGENPGSALNLSLKSNKIVMGIHDGSRYISNEYDFVYDDNQWHHFVVTKTKKAFIVYINGHKSLEYKGSFSGFGSYPLIFGSYNGSGYYFSGDIDEISLWSKGLSKGDIKRIYNSGVATNIYLHPSSTHLKKWWRMGDSKKDTEKSVYESVSKTFSTLVE